MGMTILILGMVIFVGIHLLPTFSSVRNGMFENLGEQKYKGVFSAVAGVGLILIIVGKAYAEFHPVWSPPVWSRHLAWTAMVPALILIVGANVPCNIKRFTPHPMMWAVTIWSSAHLFANGDLASMILFGGFLFFAIVSIVSGNMRGAQKQTEKLPLKKDIAVTGMGLATYLVIGFLHPWLFKVSAFL